MRSQPGTLKWKYKTGDEVFSSPAIGVDGTIYVGSFDDYLYAINGNSGGLADTPWPMFHHNVSHSERVSEVHKIRKIPLEASPYIGCPFYVLISGSGMKILKAFVPELSAPI
ncbi:MAG: hypothetical protein DRP50_08090 [Thermotoga sp.]|mgnify:CR=1 FL=1|nr:MAG: hypothetical protein DRP50_08090 [Thermotoga sp.]